MKVPYISRVDKGSVQPFLTNQPYSKPYAKQLEVLINDFYYKDDNVDIIIPAGSVNDGATIPRILWTTTGSPFLPEFRKASIIHDYLYKTGLYSKKIADKTFHKLLRQNDVSKFTAYKMYLAVKFGGIFPWKKWRKKDRQ